MIFEEFCCVCWIWWTCVSVRSRLVLLAQVVETWKSCPFVVSLWIWFSNLALRNPPVPPDILVRIPYSGTRSFRPAPFDRVRNRAPNSPCGCWCANAEIRPSPRCRIVAQPRRSEEESAITPPDRRVAKPVRRTPRWITVAAHWPSSGVARAVNVNGSPAIGVRESEIRADRSAASWRQALRTCAVVTCANSTCALGACASASAGLCSWTTRIGPIAASTTALELTGRGTKGLQRTSIEIRSPAHAPVSYTHLTLPTIYSV